MGRLDEILERVERATKEPRDDYGAYVAVPATDDILWLLGRVSTLVTALGMASNGDLRSTGHEPTSEEVIRRMDDYTMAAEYRRNGGLRMEN